MGKKRSRTKKISKGIVPTMSRGIIKALAKDVPFADQMIHKLDAWKKNKNPWVTIANPIQEQTNKRFIKVKANGLWGDPKKTRFVMPQGRELI